MLHATDFSRTSEAAFAHALRIALSARARLTLFHADPRPDGTRSWRSFPSVRRTLARWGVVSPDVTKAEVVHELGLRVEKIATRGDPPARAIGHYLFEHSFDLIVIATRAREGIPRWLRPAAAEPVPRATGASTLFVPHEARGFVSPKDGSSALERIVVATGDTDDTQPALDRVAGLARSLECERIEVHAIHAGPPGEAPAIDPPEDPPCAFTRETHAGPALDAVERALRERSPDLVAVTTAGGLFDAPRVDLARQLLRRAPCPLLIVSGGRTPH